MLSSEIESNVTRIVWSGDFDENKCFDLVTRIEARASSLDKAIARNAMIALTLAFVFEMSRSGVDIAVPILGVKVDDIHLISFLVPVLISILFSKIIICIIGLGVLRRYIKYFYKIKYRSIKNKSLLYAVSTSSLNDIMWLVTDGSGVVLLRILRFIKYISTSIFLTSPLAYWAYSSVVVLGEDPFCVDYTIYNLYIAVLNADWYVLVSVMLSLVFVVYSYLLMIAVAFCNFHEIVNDSKKDLSCFINVLKKKCRLLYSL